MDEFEQLLYIKELDVNEEVPFCYFCHIVDPQTNENKLIIFEEEENTYISSKFNKLSFIKFETNLSDKPRRGMIVKGEEEIIKILYNHMINMQSSIWEALIFMNHNFSWSKKEYKKFLGDFAEALFIHKIGGKKLFETSTADIIYNGQMIEVKSYSNQKKTITISDIQIKEKTIKYIVPLELSNDGLNIKQLAEKIKNIDPEFSYYLSERYSNDSYNYLIYNIQEPINITKFLKYNIDLPKNFLSAKYEISIAEFI
ncbi:hypothetical protein [Spiroplasma endosymbiont of Aspidapion aeneum]|uniref:hypothetical protein n=1 Tax=Spiroplasma endosymbiont of Aspidapion aeneum TaxID=3066276 RepID=UPI00313C2FC5